MAMTKRISRKKKKKALINHNTIIKMSHEEREQFQKDSDNFFDNLPEDFHTDLRYADGVEHFKNIDKEQAHRAIMALLFEDDSRLGAIQYFYDHIETKHQSIPYPSEDGSIKTGYENVDLNRSLKYKKYFEK